MDYELRFASNWNKTETVHIDTIEDLKALYNKYEARLIIDFDDHYILIYDYYIE